MAYGSGIAAGYQGVVSLEAVDAVQSGALRRDNFRYGHYMPKKLTTTLAAALTVAAGFVRPNWCQRTGAQHGGHGFDGGSPP